MDQAELMDDIVWREREGEGAEDMLYDTCTVTTCPGLEDDLEMLPASTLSCAD